MRTRLAGRLRMCALAVIACAMATVPAAADDDAKSSYRAVIDRVELEPAAIGGDRLRIYLSALTLDGQLLDLTDPRSIRLVVGTSELKDPHVVGRYGATVADTAIVFVVEATSDYTDALPFITDALDRTIFADLGEHTQVAVLPYGDSSGTGKLASGKAAHGKLSALVSDGSAGDPALLDTLERALLLLKRAKTNPEGQPLRKLIVVIGDGRDKSSDRDRVTRLGKRAAKEGVRIHALGHSPTDVRRPLLLLGELSRQSLGTFRWVRSPATADSWAAQLKHLHDELHDQYVLTYFVASPDEVAGKKLHIETVGMTVATSNEVKAPAATCGADACEVGYCAADHCIVPLAPTGRGILGWLLLIGGIGIGAVVVLGTIGFAMSRKSGAPRPAPVPRPVVPGAPPVAAPAARAAPVAAGAPAAVRPSAQQPVLYFMGGPRAGQMIALRHGFTIGKAPTSDLVIDDGYASTVHAQIAMDAHGNCQLYDRGSTNGTFVNGVRITEYALSHGVSVRIGSTELRFLSQ